MPTFLNNLLQNWHGTAAKHRAELGHVPPGIPVGQHLRTSHEFLRVRYGRFIFQGIAGQRIRKVDHLLLESLEQVAQKMPGNTWNSTHRTNKNCFPTSELYVVYNIVGPNAIFSMLYSLATLLTLLSRIGLSRGTGPLAAGGGSPSSSCTPSAASRLLRNSFSSSSHLGFCSTDSGG